MQQELERQEKKRDAKNRILRFLTRGDLQLNPAEEAILSRWEYADLLMRQGITLTEVLIKQITDKYSVSRFTADSDISNAMEVFSKSRKINRRYLGHLHLQDIAADLVRVRDKFFKNKAVPDSKDLQALAKMHDAYTYQLNSLPEDEEQVPVGKIIMQFELPAGQTMQAPLEMNDALRLADEIIDIEYEDITMENRKEKD